MHRQSVKRWFSIWLAATASSVAFLAGCKHVDLDVAAPPVASLGGGPADRLEAGRLVYLGEAKCARCHHPKLVADYSANAWTSEILPRMARKAKLSRQEYDDVQAYILAAGPKPSR